MVLCDLNDKVGCMIEANVMDELGVKGGNDNGRRMLNMYIGNTHFKY